MRALTVLGLFAAIGCQRSSEVPPAPATAAAPASAASASSGGSARGASCEEIRRDLRREQARLAKLPQRCTSDADCELYGGHQCPNPLVQVCPDGVARSSVRALQGLEDAWEQKRCGEILWSPYQREAVCVAGLCRGAEAD